MQTLHGCSPMGKLLLSCTNLWGLTQHRLSPYSKSTSLSISKQCRFYWKLCGHTRKRVITVYHVENNLKELLFKPFLFSSIALFNYQLLGLHFPSEPILQISVIVPNNPALILKGCALQDKAKAGIIYQTKALWKSIKQLSMVKPMCLLGWRHHPQPKWLIWLLTWQKQTFLV